MADNTKLISDLPPLSELRDDDVLFCMRGSISYKLPGSVVKALALGGSAYIGYYGGVPYWYVYDPETGEHVRSVKAQGPEGPKITNTAVDDSYHLIITLDDGTEYDAGYVRGPGGAGTGDMLEEDYDPAGDVKAAGGIDQYARTVTQRYMAGGSALVEYAWINNVVVLVNARIYASAQEYEATLPLPVAPFAQKTIAAAVFPEASLYAKCEISLAANSTTAGAYLVKQVSSAEWVTVTFMYMAKS